MRDLQRLKSGTHLTRAHFVQPKQARHGPCRPLCILEPLPAQQRIPTA